MNRRGFLAGLAAAPIAAAAISTPADAGRPKIAAVLKNMRIEPSDFMWHTVRKSDEWKTRAQVENLKRIVANLWDHPLLSQWINPDASS